jgi:hypothetical protein
MTKLNLKVIDMENSIVEFAKAVMKTFATDLIHYIYSKSTLPSRITVRRDSLPTRSERHSTSNKVSGI